MNCREAKNQISLLVDGYLDAKSQELVLRHIESCDECRALYNEMQKAVSQLSDLEPVALPEGFENRMHFALKREATDKKQSKFLKYSMIAMPAAAAAVAVILGVNYIFAGTSMKKEAMPESNMFAMDSYEAEMPESAPAAEKEENVEAKGIMPQNDAATKCDDSDGSLSGATNLAKSFGVVVTNEVADEKSETVRTTEYMETAKSIVQSLGIDESSIVMSEDSKCMTVAIPVELYEDFLEAVQDNNFVVENEPVDIGDVKDHSYFEVTFLFQD